MQSTLKQEGFNRFNGGLNGLDFTLSTHLPPGDVWVSFLADDLEAVKDQSKKTGISYEGPSLTHSGMTTIHFKSPEGLLIKVNTPKPSYRIATKPAI